MEWKHRDQNVINNSDRKMLDGDEENAIMTVMK